QIYSFGQTEQGTAYIAMELLEGVTLETAIANESPMHKERFKQIFLPILDAMVFAHSHKIMHRDLKPSNIMICSINGAEQIKILDFGIAKTINDDNQGLTGTATSLIGSPLYMSPEQCAQKKTDGRSDIYSLACIMYESLSGKPPFSGESVFETMYGHLQRSIPKLETISASQELSRSLISTIMQALSKDPEDRQKSMLEFKEQISAALQADDIFGAKKKATKSPVKQKLIWLSVGGLTVILLVFALCSPPKTKTDSSTTLKSINPPRNESSYYLRVGRRSVLADIAKLEAQRKFEEALVLAKQGLIEAEKENSDSATRFKYDCYLAIADLYQDMGKLDLAESNYQKARLCYPPGCGADRLLASKKLAELQSLRGHENDAISTYKDEIKHSEATIDSTPNYRIADMYSQFARMLYKYNHEKETLEALKKAFWNYDGVSRGRRNTDAVLSSWLYFRICKKQGKTKLAEIEIEKTKNNLQTPYPENINAAIVEYAVQAASNGEESRSRDMYEFALSKLQNRRDEESIILRAQCRQALKELKLKS
ncbi:MAG: serine/threonine protein kinase, partial [Candidatus Obscuribacterales bacterium]|nr:serine/threonine protein kinase [Candidatus Obscuribacterales bacterium]